MRPVTRSSSVESVMVARSAPSAPHAVIASSKVAVSEETWKHVVPDRVKSELEQE